MEPTEKFDLIVKFEENNIPQEFNEEIAMEKLEDELKNHDPGYYIKETEFYNIFMVEFKKDRLKTAQKLQDRSVNDDFEMVLIESVVSTSPEKILENILNISKNRIKDGETFTIKCNIKGKRYIKTREAFINSVYKELEKINGKPDEISPDWVINIEALGENTGISVLRRKI